MSNSSSLCPPEFGRAFDLRPFHEPVPCLDLVVESDAPSDHCVRPGLVFRGLLVGLPISLLLWTLIFGAFGIGPGKVLRIAPTTRSAQLPCAVPAGSGCTLAA